MPSISSAKRCAVAFIGVLLFGDHAFSADSLPPMPHEVRELISHGFAFVDAHKAGVICSAAEDSYQQLSQLLKVPGRKVIYLPPHLGLCYVSHALEVPSDTALFAQPNTVTLLPTRDSGQAPLVLLLRDVKHASIWGIGFSGGASDGESELIRVYHSSDVRLVGLKLEHHVGIGVLVSTSVSRVSISDSQFYDVGNRWRVTGLPKDRHQAIAFCCGEQAENVDNTIHNNSFIDIGLDSISITDQERIAIFANHCIGTPSQRDTLRDASDFPACIYGNRNKDVDVYRNLIEHQAGGGIDMVDSVDLRVTRNEISDIGGAGIGIYGITEDLLLAENHITDSAAWPNAAAKGAISIGGRAQHVSLLNNYMMSKKGPGRGLFALHLPRIKGDIADIRGLEGQGNVASVAELSPVGGDFQVEWRGVSALFCRKSRCLSRSSGAHGQPNLATEVGSQWFLVGGGVDYSLSEQHQVRSSANFGPRNFEGVDLDKTAERQPNLAPIVCSKTPPEPQVMAGGGLINEIRASLWLFSAQPVSYRALIFDWFAKKAAIFGALTAAPDSWQLTTFEVPVERLDLTLKDFDPKRYAVCLQFAGDFSKSNVDKGEWVSATEAIVSTFSGADGHFKLGLSQVRYAFGVDD